MSGCHEPTKSTKDLMIEYIDSCNESFRTLETLIKINEKGLQKCFEWAEKFENELTTKKYMEQNLREACARIEKLEDDYDSKRDTRKDLNESLSAIQDDYKNKIEKLEQEINSIMGQIEGLSTHIEKVHDLVNLEDRITASDILNRLTLLEMSIHPDSTSKSPAIASLAERMRILEEFYNQQRNIISALETANGENSRQLIFIQEQDKQGFSWHKGQIEALAERIKLLENADDDERIEDLEQIQIEKRLTALENHKNYQIDENRKISKRLDEIDKQIIETRIQFINQIGNEKRPHTCPVCNGMGEWELQSIEETIKNDNKRFKTCHSCEGKGVLWG